LTKNLTRKYLQLAFVKWTKFEGKGFDERTEEYIAKAMKKDKVMARVRLKIIQEEFTNMQ